MGLARLPESFFLVGLACPAVDLVCLVEEAFGLAGPCAILIFSGVTGATGTKVVDQIQAEGFLISTR